MRAVIMSRNFTDAAATGLTSNEEFETYDYRQELQQATYSQESPAEKRIEEMLFSHSRYYVYCE
jgi:hypothetical protein